MAAIEVKVCDRCGKVLEDYLEHKYHISDWKDAYSYDLCDDCKEVYKIYYNKREFILTELDELAEAYGFREFILKNKELKEHMLEKEKKNLGKNWFKRMFIRKE